MNAYNIKYTSTIAHFTMESIVEARTKPIAKIEAIKFFRSRLSNVWWDDISPKTIQVTRRYKNR